MKNLKNLKEAKVLNKKEQRMIKGGKRYCSVDYPCPPGQICVNHICVIEILP